MHSLPTLSLMDKVLVLRRVPLLSDLTPIDLKHIATIADERVFHAGEFIARQPDDGGTP